MNQVHRARTLPRPSGIEGKQEIEEAAYYRWLSRGRYAQAGDDLTDWLEAENELRDCLKEP